MTSNKHAATLVCKKKSPNSKVTLYLGKRNFVDHISHTDPIDGVVVVENDYLNGRKVFGELITKYIYGREQDEVMGLKFSKEFILINEEIVPNSNNNMKQELSYVQKRLLKKYGDNNAYPFTFYFPDASPCSVVIQSLVDEQSRPLGVEYYVRMYVANKAEEERHKRSTMSLAIKKIQYANLVHSKSIPNALINKGFAFSPGKIILEVILDKDIYYHGENISVNILISNTSRKTVRNITACVVQHCDVTMVMAQVSRYVARIKTREGCPVTPGESLNKVFSLVPSAKNNKAMNGVALDGYLTDKGVTLASSTLFPEGKSAKDALGIVVSYFVRVKLNCGHLAGNIIANVPFKLVRRAPESREEKILKAKKKLNVKSPRDEVKCVQHRVSPRDEVKCSNNLALSGDEVKYSKHGPHDEKLLNKKKMSVILSQDNVKYNNDDQDMDTNVIFEDFSPPRLIDV